jgi:hypothetical protein
MEITSSEEVHLLALFDKLDDLKKIQDIIYDHLSGTNREEIFGCQAIVNDFDEVEGFNDKFLLGATKLPLLEIIHLIHSTGGLAVGSHIDRESFSIISQLGFIEPDIPLDALEVTYQTGIQGARIRYPELARFPIIESSDAHFIKDNTPILGINCNVRKMRVFPAKSDKTAELGPRKVGKETPAWLRQIGDTRVSAGFTPVNLGKAQFDKMVELQYRLRNLLKRIESRQERRSEILWAVLNDQEVWNNLSHDPNMAWNIVQGRYLNG